MVLLLFELRELLLLLLVLLRLLNRTNMVYNKIKRPYGGMIDRITFECSRLTRKRLY